MEVTVLRQTEDPERLVCQAARGDYYAGYVGDTDYDELMEGVEWKPHHLDGLPEMVWPEDESARIMLEAACNLHLDGEKELSDSSLRKVKTRAFVEKQLSRGHYGPWEHPQITFTVKGVSRVTMAQITRHRLMSFDVQSMRYVDFNEAECVTPKSLTDPDHFSRESGLTDLPERKRLALKEAFETQVEQSMETYENLVDAGIPKEDARYVLPLGMKVNMTFSGNARTFLHLLDMRKKANAQWEIRELSEKLLDELFDWMPFTFNYYEEHGPNKLAP